ncbi:MAG TPA: hypothetical protein VH497_13355 [Vicinamibacterales bacterium]|jgi:hypothetical protein
MKPLAPAVLLAVSTLTATAAAQNRPDFSGTWTLDPSQSALAVQNEPVKSRTLVIHQGATELTIETLQEDKSDTVRYQPGGPGAMSTAGGRSSLIASVWYWDDRKLVTETVRNVSDKTVRTREVHALDSAGDEMTVETLLVVEHGYTLRGAQNYANGKDVYKRVKQ